MLERKTSRAYKRYTLLLLLVTITALVICTAVLALKRDAVPAVQGNPRQTLISYYSPNPDASQETGQAGSVSRISTTPVPAATPRPSPVPAKTNAYRVTLWEGMIGVFEDGKSSPILTAEIDTALLPEEDLSILREGIEVASLSEARAILEDYE